MQRRGLRLTVFVLFLLALGGAAYAIWTAEQQIARDSAAARAVADQAVSAALVLADLQAAQHAYVAAGQNPGFWEARVASGVQAAQAAISALGAGATSDEARNAVDAAASVIADFGQLDARVREYVAANQPLLASDLIFADGAEMLRSTGTHLHTARQAQIATVAARLSAARRDEGYVLAGTVSLTVIVALLLLPAGGRRAAGLHDTGSLASVAEAGRAESSGSLGATLDLRPSLPAPPAESPVDLRATAELCTDLARVTDTKDLPGLLDRAARILDASGLVLWVADPAGFELLPTVAHGYAPHVLGRMGTVKRDGDNATAAAFRTGRLQVVAGTSGEPGALIAPLLTLAGCVGVLSVEVRNNREKHESVRAATTIVAAQLATLVSAAPAAAAPAETRAQAEPV
jgi:hypothetical protein